MFTLQGNAESFRKCSGSSSGGKIYDTPPINLVSGEGVNVRATLRGIYSDALAEGVQRERTEDLPTPGD